MQGNPFGITREMVMEILKESSRAMQYFIEEFKKRHNVKLSGKILSETFSNLLEQKASLVLSRELGYEVRKATGDNTPDLLFTKISMPMEIKVTSGQVWRGGEFSKRASWHLMVSRNDIFDQFFVCLVNMESNGGLWVSAMQQGKNYYAPSFKKDQIYQLRENQKRRIKDSNSEYIDSDVSIFIGDVIKSKKGAVKLVLEKSN